MAQEAFKKVGTYWIIFPLYSQGKKAIWEGVTSSGLRYLDIIPKSVIKNIRNDEMRIELKNGSIIRIVGGDESKLVGAGVRGVVISEWSLQSPKMWYYIQPMLLENDGWAIFNFTPRGENHAYDMFKMAQNNDKWYVDLKTVADTGVVSPEQIEELRREGKSEEIIQQEYYCSFEGSIEGAYYADLMRTVIKEGRICSVPAHSDLFVNTYWDLGMSDSTAIWFVQTVGREIHIIDYYEATGEGFPHYASILQQKGYMYGEHWAPHDIAVRELGTGKSRLESAKNLGINFKTVPNLPLQDGIGAVRGILSRCWFDEVKTKHGINCLKQYRKEWDDKRQTFKLYPLHDWSSHGADAFRYFAIAYRDKSKAAVGQIKARLF